METVSSLLRTYMVTRTNAHVQAYLANVYMCISQATSCYVFRKLTFLRYFGREYVTVPLGFTRDAQVTLLHWVPVLMEKADHMQWFGCLHVHLKITTGNCIKQKKQN